MKTRGTIAYLKVMRSYRDAIFDKSLSPLERIRLMWFSVFFIRIWRTWLKEYNYDAGDHFITPNSYTCLELNAHMLICLVCSCMQGKLPIDALRVWLSGSQACEELFRLLRSMTSVFSTIINFTMRGIMSRINKLNLLSSTECSEDVIFPRVQRRLLQLKEESERTFLLPSSIDNIYNTIIEAKDEAIAQTKACGIVLDSYDDDRIIRDTEFVMEIATENDEVDDPQDLIEVNDESGDGRTIDEINLCQEESLAATREIENIRLRKLSAAGMPTYNETGTVGKAFDSGHFVRYKGAFIRKSTALYLLQENTQLSNDRLLRVREDQPAHLYSGSSARLETPAHVIAGDLVIFKRCDDGEKMLLGRVVQFSYMTGRTKEERSYSSTYVDLAKDTFKRIGVFANWYARNNDSINDIISFKSVDDTFAAGYISMEYYVCTILSELLDIEDSSFSVQTKDIEALLPNWKISLSTYSEITQLY